mmetsp:Transcript_60485/g.153084  ORF Transcript_60485/g.153084 Transcript_60485/m.153084 type:complete len:201 (-) Transcript_60485:724-1326(-)
MATGPRVQQLAVQLAQFDMGDAVVRRMFFWRVVGIVKARHLHDDRRAILSVCSWDLLGSLRSAARRGEHHDLFDRSVWLDHVGCRGYQAERVHHGCESVRPRRSKCERAKGLLFHVFLLDHQCWQCNLSWHSFQLGFVRSTIIGCIFGVWVFFRMDSRRQLHGLGVFVLCSWAVLLPEGRAEERSSGLEHDVRDLVGGIW